MTGTPTGRRPDGEGKGRGAKKPRKNKYKETTRTSHPTPPRTSDIPRAPRQDSSGCEKRVTVPTEGGERRGGRGSGEQKRR